MLVGNRVGVGLTIWSLLKYQFREQVNYVRIVVNPQWPHPGWNILPVRIGYCSNTTGARRFKCKDKNVNIIACGMLSLVTNKVK